jgi:uncharacterized protein (TIGR00369 family)
MIRDTRFASLDQSTAREKFLPPYRHGSHSTLIGVSIKRYFKHQEEQTMSDTQQRITLSFSAQGLMATLGADLVLVADGEVHIALPFSRHLSQQHGFVHAGAITSIVDSACGYAAMTKAPQGHEVVTAEFKINFLRPAIGERFLAIGKVQNAGKSLTVCTGEVRAFARNGPAYKVIALMQATVADIPPTER